MTFVTDLKNDLKNTAAGQHGATAAFAIVGVTDLAAEKIRDARAQAVSARKNLTSVDPRRIRDDVTQNAGYAIRQVQDVPAVVLERTLEVAGKAQGRYDAFAARGEELVNRIRTQKATQDLVAQAGQTVAMGKGAVTTVRKAVSETQASAKATLTTGRHQAERVADVVTGVVGREATEARTSAEIVTDAAQSAAAATATAAKRTRTTARKGAQASTSRAKGAATSARKSAPRARKATAAAAKNVGA